MAIRKLSLPAHGQVTYWDKVTPGFGLRCSPKSKSFVVMYGGRRQLKTLGRYPSMSLSVARSAAKRFFVDYEVGVQSMAIRAVTCEEAVARFLEECAFRNKARTVSDYQRLLGRHFTFTGDITAVTRQDIMKVISELSATPSEQSHAYVAIRTLMNWCVRHGLLEQSVVPRLKQSPTERTRVLAEEELRAVLRHAIETPFPFGPIIELLIRTGQRRSEIGQLRRSWIDGDLVIFPQGFAKNGREHRLPVTPAVQTLINYA
ncbi:MAG: integrase family protein, partial [Rhodobacteraceae bacterium]|nr:integrase family protein [Paracoccaceae bacterium]